MRNLSIFCLIPMLFYACGKSQVLIHYKPDAVCSTDRVFVLMDSFDVSQVFEEQLFIPSGGSMATNTLLGMAAYGSRKLYFFDTLGQLALRDHYFTVNKMIKTAEPDTVAYHLICSDTLVHALLESPKSTLFDFDVKGNFVQKRNVQFKGYIKRGSSYFDIYDLGYYDTQNHRILVSCYKQCYKFILGKRNFKKRYDELQIGWLYLETQKLERIQGWRSYAGSEEHPTMDMPVVMAYDSAEKKVFYAHNRSPYIYSQTQNGATEAVKVPSLFFERQYIHLDSAKKRIKKSKTKVAGIKKVDYKDYLRGYNNCAVNTGEGFATFYLGASEATKKGRDFCVIYYDHRRNTYFEQALIPESYVYPLFRNNRIYQLSPVAPQKIYVWELQRR